MGGESNPRQEPANLTNSGTHYIIFIYSAGPSPGRDEGSDETDDREEIGGKSKDGMQRNCIELWC